MGKGLLWEGGGIEQSVDGLQGLVCHCQPFQTACRVMGTLKFHRAA